MKPTTTKPHLFALLAIATSVLIMVSCTSSKKDKDKNDWNRYNLYGKVKSFKKTTYDAEEKFGNIEKGVRSIIGDNNQVIFNIKGSKLEENKYYRNGRILRKNVYKYDEKGDVIEENEYDSDGKLSDKIIYKYDKKGNLIETNRYYADGSLLSKGVFKYNQKGNKIETNTYYPNGNLDSKLLYDEKGNTIEMTLFNSEYKFEYVFDNEGNWTNRIKFENNIPQQITEREIEYF